MKRKVSVWLTVVLGTALSLWACTRHNPAGPTPVTAPRQLADGGDSAGLKVIPSVLPTQVGPSSRPIGPGSGAPGPTAMPSFGATASPIGPSPTPIGPGSGTPPSASGDPGGPGGPPPGGGGGGGGSGTPTPGGGNCPATVTLNSSDTPIVLTGSPTSVSVIDVPGSLQDCRVRAVRVSFFLVSTSLATLSQANLRAFVQLVRDNQVVAASDLFRSTGPVLGGTMMGTACPGGSTPISFQEGGNSFPGPAPYDETYQPFGLLGFPGFSNFVGRTPDGEWRFGLGYTPTTTTATLNCWRLELDLQ